MKAITLWQPWASMVIAGWKPWEFRKWDFSSRYPSLVNQRIAIAAGVRPVRAGDLTDLINRILNRQSSLSPAAVPALRRWMLALQHGQPLPLGHVLGDAIFRQPKPAIEIFGEPAPQDSDRFLQSRFAWPIDDVRAYEPPFKYRGAQGFWNCPAPDERVLA